MNWQPGQPVITGADREAWQQWRRDRKRQQQRERRARSPRIDFYPATEVLALIERERRPHVGGDASSIINRMLREWAHARGLLPPE
jgi:hypothetical protein